MDYSATDQESGVTFRIRDVDEDRVKISASSETGDAEVEIDRSVITEAVLPLDARRRVDALYAARGILQVQGGANIFSKAGQSFAGEIPDALIELASYILDEDG